MMEPSTIEEFKKNFTGTVIVPTDAQYEQLRNTMAATGSPAIILQPATNQDIAAGIQFAVDHSLTLSLRSGGHSVAGFSTNNGGLVLDLSSFNAVEILDEATHRVRIGAGAKWGDVAKELEKHGLGISSGDTKSVGVGGLTLGGGIGWMVRKYGLAIDSVVAAELVLADGSTVRASEAENPDLFWAIRGGGGNFGVVTSFEFIAHPIGTVFSGPLMFALDDVGGILRGWRDYMATADENLSIIVNILPTFFGNPPMFIMTVCYATNDKEAAMKAIEPLKKLGKVLSDNVVEKKYSEVLEEAHPPQGMKIVVRNVFAESLTDEIIDAILKAREQKEDFILQIRSLGGAMKRVAPDATAFTFRSSEVLLLGPTFAKPDATDAQMQEALKPWMSIEALGTGPYSGFMSTATDEDVAAIFPDATRARLQKIKQQVDPKNVFNQNYNVKPTA